MPQTPKPTNGASGPTKPRRPAASKPNGGGQPALSTDEVAKKAYEIYQSRGGQHGADFDDWIQAEQQLKSTQPQPAPSERRKRSRTSPGA